MCIYIYIYVYVSVYIYIYNIYIYIYILVENCPSAVLPHPVPPVSVLRFWISEGLTQAQS